MKSFLFFSFGLFLLLMGLVVRSINERTAPVYVVVKQSELTLGGKLPLYTQCSWMDQGDIIYCSYIQDQFVSIAYNRRTARVMAISRFVWYEGLTVGDMILRWGQPVGMRQATYGTYVYFSEHRSLFVVTKVFRPTTRVGIVSLDLLYGPECEWVGFVTKKVNC